MHAFFSSRLGLCDEQGEAPITTSGAPVAAAVPQAPSLQPPALEAPKLGVVDRAVAMFKDKGQLGTEIATLKSQLSAATTERDGLAATLAAITAERDGMKAEFAKLETALAASVSSQTTVQAEVVHQLATQGVPEARLPKTAPPTSQKPVMTAEQFNTLTHPERNKFFRDGGKLID